MKVSIAFVILAIVAVFGQDEETIRQQEIQIFKMLKEASKACGLEMNVEPVYVDNNEGFIRYPANITVEACLKACVDKKIGVLTEDGTYSLERILSYTPSPRIKKLVAESFASRAKNCTSLVGEPCKLTACMRGMPKCSYMDVECV